MPGQPELVARLIIDNKEAIDALKEMQEKGVDATNEVAAGVDAMPIKFAAWGAAIEIAGKALEIFGRQLERAIELAAEEADINSAAFAEYNKLTETYDKLLKYIGELILENQDFADALETVRLLFEEMVANGDFKRMVEDFAKITKEVATLLDWSMRLRDVFKDMQNVMTGQALRNVVDNFKELTGAVEETTNAIEEMDKKEWASNRTKGDAIRLADEHAQALEREAEAARVFAEGEEAFAKSREVVAQAEEARHIRQQERLQELRDWVKEGDERIAKQREMVADAKESLADLFLSVSDAERDSMRQRFADIDLWVAKSLEGVENVAKAERLRLTIMDEEKRKRVELYDIFNESDANFRHKMERQYPLIKQWRDEWFDATASTKDKLEEMFDAMFTGNRGAIGGIEDLAGAVETVGDAGADALRRMAREAGIFIDKIDNASGKMTSRIELPDDPEEELAMLKNGTHPLIRSGMSGGMLSVPIPGYYPHERESYLKKQIYANEEAERERDAERIGRAVGRTIAELADRDGTLTLARAGIRR